MAFWTEVLRWTTRVRASEGGAETPLETIIYLRFIVIFFLLYPQTPPTSHQVGG